MSKEWWGATGNRERTEGPWAAGWGDPLPVAGLSALGGWQSNSGLDMWQEEQDWG